MSANAKALQKLSPSRKPFSYSKSIENLVKLQSGHAEKCFAGFFCIATSLYFYFSNELVESQSGLAEKPFASHGCTYLLILTI